MNLTLNLSSTELESEDLQVLTRQLCDSIVDETEIEAEIPCGVVQQGHKGDIVTVGTIALTFISSGAAVALFNIFKAYFDRNSSFTIKAKKSDGTELEISAQNLKLEQIQSLLAQFNQSQH
jgi:hypothetical protein